jgi:RNA polymerase sigma-B factor
VAELAERLGLTDAEVIEGQQAANAYTSGTLDSAADSEEVEGPLARRLGYDEPALDYIECAESLKPLIAELPERSRTILSLRFVEELTQAQIGERLGISQMHVSRLLARALGTLRAQLLTED